MSRAGLKTLFTHSLGHSTKYKPLSGTAVVSVYLFTVSNGSLLLMLEVSTGGACYNRLIVQP